MDEKEATVFEEFEKSLLEKPEINREYEALQPKYDLIRSLIERRNELGLSQTQLAKIIGTKQPAVSRLEKGDYNTTLNTLFRVADAMNLEVNITLKSRRTIVPTRKRNRTGRQRNSSEVAPAVL